MIRVLRSFAANESGTTAIEYGLIASLIFLVIVGGVTAAGGATGALFDLVAAMFP
jgi:pilus assembly protein Flp/PilA